MLVLSRKPGDRIYIGNLGFIEISAVKGDRVKVSLYFPPEIIILRGELSEAVARGAKPPGTKLEQRAAESGDDAEWQKWADKTIGQQQQQQPPTQGR